jgi:hypothetical protein
MKTSKVRSNLYAFAADPRNGLSVSTPIMPALPGNALRWVRISSSTIGSSILGVLRTRPVETREKKM